jgi:hypothetical protein
MMALITLSVLLRVQIESGSSSRNGFFVLLRKSNPAMRILFIISYILFGAGLNVHIFRKYEINYMEIFGFDQ